jgi:hypothetical protein
MTKDLKLQIIDVRSAIHQRMADRLGFLLAKRWIRLHQKPGIDREDQRPKPD